MQTYKLITSTTFNAETDDAAKAVAQQIGYAIKQVVPSSLAVEPGLYDVSAPDMPGGREVL